MTQQNASASEELASTSEELTGQAEALRVAMTFFKTETEKASGERKLPVKTKTQLTHSKLSLTPKISSQRMKKETNHDFEKF